ncbi:eukaryotic cytochrome b561-domain-containing protein [Lineolata rhizophorae]|uniref:Eukaryotic cytochrome b561-domain-containing protein n=1 Tax=Lineolata rhizophorae TaxID=578093 RepID=A0A6A6NVF7_9PEZI|nr:eukaryotic cytochrome b561-domain-containing protein [Lineolata rhizophorae]
MASATGMPDQSTAAMGRGEEEPLLGRAGDASQEEDKPLYYNFVLGTGMLAQAGIWVLTAIVWGNIFSNNLIFFSPHPLLNSAGILLITQAALILQPTHTPSQKRYGTWSHAALVDVGVASLIAGLVIIEINKFGHGGTHFDSPHSIMGLITYILVILQASVGFTSYFVPQLYGGEDRAKSVYKYHRMSGYVILTLAYATICAATQTFYAKNFLHMQLWSVIVASVITLAGLLPRIKKQKLGFKSG